MDSIVTESIYPSLSPGTEIAGYRIESLLGRGGMAVVFKARDLRLDRPVGLKVLAPELSESPQFRDRFLRESRLAASLDHPNIIPVYEAGEDHGLLFIAMRLVGGGDLAERLRQAGRLSPADTVGIVGQVAAALDAAHAAGLVHRDVKPGNILVVPGVAGQHRDHVYLSDFGLTKRVTSLSGVTAQGQFIATMDYAAPEQIGSRPVDARTDVYGLGCVAYQCLTGSVPFVRDNEAALLWAHLVERPPPVSAHQVGLAPFDAAVARALEKNPEDRFDSCGQFVDALAAALPTPAAAPTTDPIASPAAPAAPSKPTPDTTPGIHTALPANPADRAGHVADSTFPWPGPGVQASPSQAGPVEPPAVLPGAAARSNEQPERRSDEDVPDATPASPDSGQPGAGRRRRRRLAALVAALVLIAVSTVFIAQNVSSGSSTAVAAATRQCRTAYASADQTLPKGQDVATQLRLHAGIMAQMGGANSIVAGRPALTTGATAAAQYEDRLADYKPLAADCAQNSAATQACKTRISVADQAVGHADKVVTALMQHTAIMNQWDSGQLTADQAHMQGKPSLDTGLAESDALDQSVRDYQQQAGNC